RGSSLLPTRRSSDLAHEMGNAEDHGPGRALLEAAAVHLEPHAEVLGVRHLVAGHQPGADGTEGVAALALVPGAGALGLEFAFGEDRKSTRLNSSHVK